MSEERWSIANLEELEEAPSKEEAEILAAESDAIELLKTGKYRLLRQPTSPPWTMLRDLQQLIKRQELLGPTVADPATVAKVQSRLFENAIRQTSIKGYPIEWWRGKSGLREFAGRQLSLAENLDIDLFALFRFIGFFNPEHDTITSLKRKGSIYQHDFFRQRSKSLNDMGMLAVVKHRHTAEWKEFIFEALGLQADFEETLTNGLADGRILVGQSSAGGDRFTHPAVASAMPIMDIDETYYFASSADIQNTVLNELPPLNARRNNAVNWLTAAFAHFQKLGLRPTQSVVQLVLKEKFQLTANACKDVWDDAKPSNLPIGNLPANEKVAFEELQDHFENYQRGK